MERDELKSILECLLFVSDKPLSLSTLQGLLESVDRRTLLAALDELKAEYDQQKRAFQLMDIAEGYQLATRVQYAPWIRKMYKTRTASKLSRAALETLAIIAYRQPITRAEIEDVRGVAADSVVSLLLERKFIRLVGRKEVVGRPMLYGTTKDFLHYFGLKDLNDMPTLKDLEDILVQDEAGENWEISPEGELVAKVKSGEEPATPSAGPAQAQKKKPDEPGEEDVSEDGNGKPDTEIELEPVEGDEDLQDLETDENEENGDEPEDGETTLVGDEEGKTFDLPGDLAPEVPASPGDADEGNGRAEPPESSEWLETSRISDADAASPDAGEKADESSETQTKDSENDEPQLD